MDTETKKPIITDQPDLKTLCLDILKTNDQGNHTSPAKLYPHQWLWDSCFIAIGIRHSDPKRAVKEIRSLIRGQWANGMIPHMIFNKGREYRLEREAWRSWLSPYAPDTVATSGITQPPVIADTVVKIGEKLSAAEKREFYHVMYGPLVEYHQWLYNERDPHGEGLTLQIHPNEVGMDNTPPWVKQLYEHNRPVWVAAIEKLKLDAFVNFIRRDTRRVNPGQRISNMEALLLWDVVRRLRRKQYDIDKILHRTLFATEDILFNSVLIRNNAQLKTIASYLKHKLPSELIAKMKLTEEALEQLYDEPSNSYYSRDFITHKLILEPSIGSLMPLYAGTISHERAAELVKALKDHKQFWLHHPVPSVPLNSTYFSAERYWQGPSWVNTNWLLIDGLTRYGFTDEAKELKERTLAMVENAGCYEYFSPIDGKGLGAENFSWTAALVLDLINQ